ncbi:hypothetical protein KIN20_020189 [Parelaphostrongylus tenuis]|uniref:Uncharacterized protein n=1 Tax=Parelaphostrongylus tenuis TaxID=148309 RepID=A0AAD5N5N9_PARTN|nr:hypothetical protein KIN20_020189 [Parelaphostrongylus tenuis]
MFSRKYAKCTGRYVTRKTDQMNDYKSFSVLRSGQPLLSDFAIVECRDGNSMWKRFREANYVDDVYPFIWINFSSLGYVTLYGEDAFAVGTFTYRLKGFRKKPTDHYLRTIFKEYEDKNFGGKCLGSEPLHKAWLRYSREFMTVYSDMPRFLSMHQGLLSHDDINLVEVEDEDLADHVFSMHKNGELSNTLVIVMADHGHRFTKIRATHQGQLEEVVENYSFPFCIKLRYDDGL